MSPRNSTTTQGLVGGFHEEQTPNLDHTPAAEKKSTRERNHSGPKWKSRVGWTQGHGRRLKQEIDADDGLLTAPYQWDQGQRETTSPQEDAEWLNQEHKAWIFLKKHRWTEQRKVSGNQESPARGLLHRKSKRLAPKLNATPKKNRGQRNLRSRRTNQEISSSYTLLAGGQSRDRRLKFRSSKNNKASKEAKPGE
jgi:hypothetical protein